MKRVILIFLILVPIFVFAQERKTYKGSYIYNGNRGSVVYDYIETENGRIFDGYFKFNGEFGNTMYGYEEGYFKKGIKDGLWTVGWGRIKKTFINGNLNGLLETGYNGDIYSRSIIDYYNRKYSKIWYKDNHFAGSFSIGSYTGQFDSDGYADGEWISYGKDDSDVIYKQTQKWEHGYLVSDIAYDESNGRTTNLIIEDKRSWHNRCKGGKYITYSDGTTYYEEYFDPGRFDTHVLIADFFFGNYEKNMLVIKSGFRKGTTGEYAMTVFPFIGIRRPLTEHEQQELDAKRKEERSNLYKEYDKYFPDKSAFEKEYDKIGKEAMTKKALEIKKMYEEERDILYSQFTLYFPDKLAFEKEYDKIGKEAMLQKAQKTKGVYIQERDNLYNQFAKYYPDKLAFETLYDRLGKQAMSKQAQQEADRQDLEAFKLLIEKIKPAKFNDKKDKSGMIIQVAIFKYRAIYPAIIQFVIENNKNLSKKWEKEGRYFDNQTEFYEACTSGEYKTVLTGKKNAMK